jgi:glutaredoxin
MPHRDRVLTLYSRAGCHLCERARAIVAPLCAEYGITLRVADVDGGADTRARHGDRIPVAVLDGVELLAWPFDRASARRSLAAAAGRTG